MTSTSQISQISQMTNSNDNNVNEEIQMQAAPQYEMDELDNILSEGTTPQEPQEKVKPKQRIVDSDSEDSCDDSEEESPNTEDEEEMPTKVIEEENLNDEPGTNDEEEDENKPIMVSVPEKPKEILVIPPLPPAPIEPEVDDEKIDFHDDEPIIDTRPMIGENEENFDINRIRKWAKLFGNAPYNEIEAFYKAYTIKLERKQKRAQIAKEQKALDDRKAALGNDSDNDSDTEVHTKKKKKVSGRGAYQNYPKRVIDYICEYMEREKWHTKDEILQLLIDNNKIFKSAKGYIAWMAHSDRAWLECDGNGKYKYVKDPPASKRGKK